MDSAYPWLVDLETDHDDQYPVTSSLKTAQVSSWSLRLGPIPTFLAAVTFFFKQSSEYSDLVVKILREKEFCLCLGFYNPGSKTNECFEFICTAL